MPEQPSTQELLALDNDDEIFDLINQKIHSPSWISTWSQKGEHPAAHKASYMPSTVMVPRLAPVPSSARSGYHSRSSSSSSVNSRSSNSSGSPQYSIYSLSSDDSEGSWRQKALRPDCQKRRPAPPQVDVSKAAITAYDGGKTLVASGGVTLGSMGRTRRV